MERTLILVKPDAFARGLTGEIVARFERKGLKIVAMRHMQVTEDLAKQHYAEHDGKPFFGELVEFITSGPIVAMVLEGEEAIKAARQVIGATNPLEATTGLDPRRLRDRGRPEHGPRLRLAGVGRARGEAVLRLASASPQRRAILEQLGVAFDVRPADVEEHTAGDPRALAPENARRKALAVPGDLVLGADTDVALDGEMLGKPRDAAQARELLGRLAGRRHEVVGGIALARGGELVADDVVVTASSSARSSGDARLVRRHRRVGGPRRRLRDPGPRRRAGRGHRGRLPQRRRAAARPAARPRAGLLPAS